MIAWLNKNSKKIMCILSLVLVLAVGFFPTVAKASTYDYVGFNGSASFAYQYSSYGIYKNLFTGGTGSSAVGNLEPGNVDQTDDNMRLVFNFDSSSMVQSAGRYIEFTTLFQLKSRGYDNMDHYFNPRAISSISGVMSNGTDSQRFYPNFSFEQASSGSVFLTLHFYAPLDIDTLNFVVYFNFFDAFGFNVSNYTDVANFFGVQNYFHLGKYSDIEIGEVDKPDVDSIKPNVDEHLDEETLDLFHRVFARITETQFVTSHLIVVFSVAFIGYVLFGKRGS